MKAFWSVSVCSKTYPPMQTGKLKKKKKKKKERKTWEKKWSFKFLYVGKIGRSNKM